MGRAAASWTAPRPSRCRWRAAPPSTPSWKTRVGDAIGREIRALGGNYFGGVCINLLRHPAWGRAQESYGEDSFLLGVMGAALATGVQHHVMACVKHFALNSMENMRQDVDVTADARTLHEVYLAHFKRVVDAGVASLMTAYNSVNGEWAGQNRALIADILKDKWGFNGFTVTDFITGMRDAKKAALAGQDVEMPFATIYAMHLKDLVDSGDVPMSRIDDAALRLLRQQVRFGQGRDAAEYQTERRRLGGPSRHRSRGRGRRASFSSRTRAACCRLPAPARSPSSAALPPNPIPATAARA